MNLSPAWIPVLRKHGWQGVGRTAEAFARMATESNPMPPAAGTAQNGPATALLPPGTAHRGDLRLLAEPLTALFCSGRCPGDLILQAYDLAKALREAGAPVIGGFQTPLEKECLRLLLRGRQPVVVCPARGIGAMRIPREWRGPLAAGRLLILSPFPETQRRPTAQSAARRNDLVAALARRVLFIHAAPGSKTEALARKLAATGKPLLTPASAANENLVEMGAEAVGTEQWERKGREMNGPLDAADASQCMQSRLSRR